MGEDSQNNPFSTEIESVIRKRNQLTLPAAAVDILGLRVGDVVVIEVREGGATLRPVRRSYAGMATGIYGDAEDYVAKERGEWE